MHDTLLVASRRALAVLFTTLVFGCASDEQDAAKTDTWPKRVTLRSDNKFDGERVRLEDGKVSDSGGDVMLTLAMVVALGSPKDELIFCEKGKHSSLADIPLDTAECEERWVQRIYLSAGNVHTMSDSLSKDMAFLVRHPTSGRTYRMRLLGESVADEASATFEYEPLP